MIIELIVIELCIGVGVLVEGLLIFKGFDMLARRLNVKL